MNRIPPNLLYLAIYNPTLRPSNPIADDNEDAEEQAHILFYTSKERAVSRDRMLRQIGLAKALSSFVELFNPNDPCDCVHSQSKRMVLVSPEPNFWINASIELGKTQQFAAPTRNSMTKLKAKDKEKGLKDKLNDSSVAYDYEDGTIHDAALRAHLLQGYEQFKLTHGSFTSILATLGQQALELQLERFFTVWAWSWNLEEMSDIVEQFGVSLHPSFSTLIPLLDDYGSLFTDPIIPVILTTSYIIPSTRYTETLYPSSLARHLISMIPPPTTAGDDTLASSVDTLKALSPATKTPLTGLFTMPAVNMNVDVRKWNWSGVLTFGRNSSSSTSKSTSPLPLEKSRETADQPSAADADDNDDNEGESDRDLEDAISQRSGVVVHVDSSALEDAMSSDGLSIVDVNIRDHYSDSRTVDGQSGFPMNGRSPSVQEEADGDDRNNDDLEPPHLRPDPVSSSPKSSITVSARHVDYPLSRPLTPPSAPQFSRTKVHISPVSRPTETTRQTIYFHIRNGFMLALLGVEGRDDIENEDLVIAAEHRVALFDEISYAVNEGSATKGMSESLPSANKILQPLDRHAISIGQYMLSSPGFSSDSSHLQNSDDLLRRDPDMIEVFSRGQNPQYWHIVKRGLHSVGHDAGESVRRSSSSNGGEIYLEVFRKEASLPDVDNVLAGVVKKSGLLESGLV